MAEQISGPWPRGNQQPRGPVPVPNIEHIPNLAPAGRNRRVYLDINNTAAGNISRMEIVLFQGTTAGDTFRRMCVGQLYMNSHLHYHHHARAGMRWRGGDSTANAGGLVFFIRSADHQLQADGTNMLFGKVEQGFDDLVHATTTAPHHVLVVTGCGELP